MPVPWPENEKKLFESFFYEDSAEVTRILYNHNELANAILPPHNIYSLILAIASKNKDAITAMLCIDTLDYKTPILSMLNNRLIIPINYEVRQIDAVWYKNLIIDRRTAYYIKSNLAYDINTSVSDIYKAFAKQYKDIIENNKAWSELVNWLESKEANLQKEYKLRNQINMIKASIVDIKNIEADTMNQLLGTAFMDKDDKFISLFLDKCAQANEEIIPEYLTVESAIHINCYNSALRMLKITSNCENIKINEVPLLIWAIDHDQQDIAQYLVDMKSQINDEYNGDTPLHRALLKGQNQLAGQLIDTGADINIYINRAPMLYWVIDAELSDVALQIIPISTQINIAHNNETPLYVALCENMPTVAMSLLVNNAKVDNKIDDNPLLIWVINKGYKEIAAWLAKNHIELINAEHNGETPLSCALQRGFTDITTLLIDNDASLDINIDGIPLLIWVVKNNDQDRYNHIASLMIEKRVQINAIYNGETPLSCALQRGFTDITTLLIDNDASLDINIDGIPLLIWVVKNNDQDRYNHIASLMIEKRVQINAKYNCETPLSCELQKGFTYLAKLLIKYGASLDINICKVPLLIWVFKEIETFHRYVDPDDVPHLHLFIQEENDYKDIAALVIENNVQIDIEYEGVTPLFCALGNGYFELAESLLDHGADINKDIIVGIHRLSYLIWSIQNGDSDVFDWLVKNGADTNHISENVSPLFAAVSANKEHFALKLCNHKARVSKDLIKSALNNNMLILSMKMIDILRNDDQHNGFQRDIEEILSTSIMLRQDSVSLNTCSIIKSCCITVKPSLLIDALETRIDIVALALIDSGIKLDIIDNDGNTPLMLAVKNNLYGSIYSLLMKECDVNKKNNHGMSAIGYANGDLKRILEFYS